MDEYTLRLVCIYAALIGSIDFEGESAYSQAARKAALAAKDVQKAMSEEGRRAAREAAKAAAEAVAKSAESDLAALGTAMGALSKAMQWRLHNSARATAAGVQEVVSRDNLKMPANVQRAYLEVVAQAVAQVNSGMAGYEKATRDAVLKLARRGVSVVEYKSGAWAQADVAMRRHIRTQVAQAGSRNTLDLMEETGHDLVQTSSHGGARPSHAKWQGRVFSLSGKSKKYPPFSRTGYGAVDGLCGANCKHDFGIYVEGQPLRYERDPDGGDEKREERYQAEQKQRAIEREIRATKREATALKAAGLDDTKERVRLGKLQKRQREHIAAHHYLARDYSRENPYETGNKKRALTRQTASRTAFMAQPDVKAAIAEAGVSRKRVGELVKAGGDGFGLMAKAERDKVLRTAINQAKAEKARDLRVADAAAMAVHDDKQAKHIAGSRQHEQYVANLKRKGSEYKEPSGITATLEEVRDLVSKHAGTGLARATRAGNWNKREVCDAGRVIGYVIGDNGEHIPTTRFTIHYAEGDVHIVPAKPKEAQQ
ncbi:phage minor capsid protein [Collinsella aerofaciens]|uniref:phage minor capsid protein n=1 Tax=Collinsella aerofaciens TaxID=74426 RepID=UPI0018971C64|nr:phage minor capsid protein [Collinsella aerofaciens]MDB1846688.1 polymorphic toxin type 50 domain-containing protein [Collinsella aerofaciens]MDB1848785.1 polymorphic toxin type 50 domain-containing protein [Collinsella aerofaciens]MDB1853962.1 polymorphic toxin type 50 domain-containing protein [Collinsella aerofaciens]